MTSDGLLFGAAKFATLSRPATRAAIYMYVLAISLSGAPTMIGRPTSPPMRMRVSIGICPRNGTQ